ncbi:MAG: ATP-binding domain-containing protein, partial [Leptolyngbya sp. SIO4C1]|nr:ATP-binding domain-containing protein [Leptolyngbya sp. SIO4C1]
AVGAIWAFRQRFHDVNYAYSLTVHKSQGSTFQDVFVDLPNLMRNPKTVERNQLVYVAFTRAAKRLFVSQPRR